MRIEPPTDTYIAPYFVVSSRQKGRFDVLQFQDDYSEYKQVFAFFSLRRSKEIGRYDNRHQKMEKTFLDSFMVCADMECLLSVCAQRLTPYAMYRLAKGLINYLFVSFNHMSLFLIHQLMVLLGYRFKTLLDHINSPSCFIQTNFYENKARMTTAQDYMNRVYYGFGY